MDATVLVAAKEMYTQQLKKYLSPLIFQFYVELYENGVEEEKKESKYQNDLMKFQASLCNIPYWNQSILEKETTKILSKVDFLMRLVAAIFLTYVKILASVRMGGNNKNIRVRIPTSDIFVHTVFCKSAEIIYYKPYSIRNHKIREDKENIMEMINTGIDDSINSMIPLENILKEYLNNINTESIKGPQEVERKDYSAELGPEEIFNEPPLVDPVDPPQNEFMNDIKTNELAKTFSDPLPQLDDIFNGSLDQPNNFDQPNNQPNNLPNDLPNNLNDLFGSNSIGNSPQEDLFSGVKNNDATGFDNLI